MLLINFNHMALNGLFCADVPLRNHSRTHSLYPPLAVNKDVHKANLPARRCSRPLSRCSMSKARARFHRT